MALDRNNSITDVLFDVDGVLVYPVLRFRDYLARVHQILPETTAPFFKGRFHACVRGQVRLQDELAGVVASWGWTEGVEAFIHRWMLEDDSPNSEMLSIVAQLRGRGVRCHVASVQEQCRAEYLRSKMGFADLFESVQFSCDLGAAKPEQAFFERIEQRLQRKSTQLLLIDDLKPCVEAARARGWSAFHYTGPADNDPLEAMLRKIGE
jgi:putative hydrolase of the HAD superfamily